MPINKAMRLALKALSYPNIDIKKVYKIQRAIKNIRLSNHLISYKMWDKKIHCDGHDILTRIYEPNKDKCNVKRDKLLLFFHGGGWVTENVNTYNKVCARLADNTGCRVASVEYRLAPEFPFPAGLNDCYTVAKDILTNPSELTSSPDNVVLIGDSAGGNLAAVVSMMLRDNDNIKVRNQILIYPSTWNDHSENSPFDSIRENGTDYLLTSKRIEDYMDMYIDNDEYLSSPLVAPLLAKDFSNMPRTLVITAEFDPLRDEGEAYARKLKKAGNEVKLYRMKDALHGFFALSITYPQVKRCYKYINKFLDDI